MTGAMGKCREADPTPRQCAETVPTRGGLGERSRHGRELVPRGWGAEHHKRLRWPLTGRMRLVLCAGASRRRRARPVAGSLRRAGAVAASGWRRVTADPASGTARNERRRLMPGGR